MRLEEIAPRLAKARDQRLLETANEREFWRRVGMLPETLAKWERSMEMVRKAGVPATEAMRRFAEAWQRPIPKGNR